MTSNPEVTQAFSLLGERCGMKCNLRECCVSESTKYPIAFMLPLSGMLRVSLTTGNSERSKIIFITQTKIEGSTVNNLFLFCGLHHSSGSKERILLHPFDYLSKHLIYSDIEFQGFYRGEGILT